MLFLVAAIFIHVVPGSFSWGFNLLPGDLGDTRFNQFVLEHGWRFLSGQVPSLWDAPIYYPFPKALALSDHLLGSQWLYAPWRLFGLDPDGALTGWLLSLFAINGLSCYVCLRFLGASPVASGLAAFPFACGLPVLAQIGHPQLLQLYPIPPALTFGLVLLKSAGRRGLAWCLGFLAWTFWCSPYLFVFTALLLALIWLWYLPDLADVLRRLAACPRDAARYAMSFLGFIVLLLPAAWPYFDISRQTGLRPFDEIAQMLPRPASLLAVNDASATWVATLAPFSVGLPMAGEHKIFPGAWVLAGSCAVASFSLARNWRHRELSLRLIGAAASIVLCVLWIGDASLWQYLSKLPGFSAIRAVTRFVLVVQFPLCVIIALGLSSSLETLRQHGRIWYILAGMLAAMALAIDQRIDVSRTATFPKEQSKARIQAVVDATPRDAKVLAYSPGPIPQNEVILSHIDAMLAAQRMGIACVNGYSGWAPPGYGFFMARPDCGGLNTWINMSWQVFARKDWRILFQDLRTVGFGPCHLDPALLDIPQSRSLGPLPQNALQARMTLVASRLDKERFRLSVDLKNESQVRWPCWGDFLHTHRICIIGRFEAMDPDSHYQPEPWRVMGELPFDLVPGQTVRLDMDPVTPRNAERLLLRLRLVQTGDQEIPVPNLVIPVPEGL